MSPKKRPRNDGEAAGPAEEPEAPAEQEAQGDASEQAKDGDPDEAAEERGPGEPEQDAPDDARARLGRPVAFLPADTTLNVMQATHGGMLMTLNEGGLQYLLAGARASVGIKSGRYMFEAKIVENLNQVEVTGSQARAPVPRNLLRVGFSVYGSPPILGDGEDSICFDSEGNMLFNRKRTPVAQKLTPDSTVAVVLNLDEKSPNASTISLFRDGERMTDPQPLPESLKGKTLYPTVTFKNLTVHVNFGLKPHVALPFNCRMVQDAAVEDTVVTSLPEPKDGTYEIMFPVMLPDEGTFEWLDWFLQRNPHYTELSERMVVDWALRSGLWRPKTHTYKSSNDRPDMNFGIPHLDDGSVKQILNTVATVQQRNLIVMEVKGNLTKQERMESIQRFASPNFKRVARVMMGEPDKDFKECVLKAKLQEKQERSDADFHSKKQERARKRLIELRQKQVERARKRADRIKKRAEEQRKRQEEAERRAAEEGADAEQGKEEAKEAEENDDDDEEMDEVPTAVEEEDEQPPKVELTEQEQRDLFKKPAAGSLADISSFILGQTFSKFGVPDDTEGFDSIQFSWSQQTECLDYLRRWNLDRKITTRIEDLQPSDWFKERWQDWQRDLQLWHMKHMEFKDPNKRAAIMAAAAKNASLKEAAEKEKKGQQNGDTAEEKKGDGKDGKTGGSNNEKKKDEKDENKQDGDEGKQEDGEKGDAEARDQEDDDPMKALEEELDRQELDIFGVDNISDTGTGEPIFASFAFEDWALLSLRFELHLLVHAFKRDCNDPERTGIHPEHLAFYYNKYYKKGLNPKNYGVDSIEDLIGLIRDTAIICMKVIESQLTDDLETNDVFVKLTEEARRERQRRLDAGEETAQLKFQSRPQDHGLLSLGARTAVRPSAVGPGPVASAPGVVQRPAIRLAMPQVGRPGFMAQRPPGQQWYAPRAMYGGLRNPGVQLQQRAMLGRSQPYAQGGWRYSR